MKQTLLAFLILFFITELQAQKRTYSLNFNCKENCDKEGDQDGDGFADCDDLDCFEYFYGDRLHRPPQSDSRNSYCPSISGENIKCILRYKENLKQIGIFSREKALSFCLNGYEDIIVIGEELIENSTFNCLLNTLLFNNGQESLFDNTIRKFQYSFPARLHFDVSANYPIRGSLCKFSSGCTYLKEVENNKITIYLDPDQSSIEMVSTILHEGIHASIGAYLNGLGVDVELIDTKRLHELYALNKSDVNTLDHRYMTETYTYTYRRSITST